MALKLLHEQFATDPEFVVRFEREVDITRRINSPHVVGMLGFGVHGGRPFAAMEYVPGESLRDRLLRAGPMTWDETSAVLRQVASGLQAAHGAGIIHRDVKPSNILVMPDGCAKLVDFGIAKAADMTTLTGASTTMGTAAYTAPEGESTPAADMYALGCTAYEMLYGQQPFVGETPAQVLIKHLRDAPDLSRLPSESRLVVAWLLEKEPGQRLSSAERLVSFLAPERVAAAPARTAAATPLPVREGPPGPGYWRPSPAERKVSRAPALEPSPPLVVFPVTFAGRRIASAFVDYLSLVVLSVVAAFTSGDSAGSALLWLGGGFLGAFLWESQGGQSPGKWLFRLVTVGPEGDPLTKPRALARIALKFAAVLLVVPALLDIVVITATHGSQRLFDKVTDTEVIRWEDAEDVP